jgi:hypothetical protein
METVQYQAREGGVSEVEIRKGKTIRGSLQPEVYQVATGFSWNVPLSVLEKRIVPPEEIKPMTDGEYQQCLAKLGLKDKNAVIPTGEPTTDEVLRAKLKKEAKTVGVKVLKSMSNEDLANAIKEAQAEDEEEAEEE